MKFTIKDKECFTNCISCNKEFKFSMISKFSIERPLKGDIIKYPNLACFECNIQYYLIVKYPEDIIITRVTYHFEPPHGKMELAQIICDYAQINRVSISFDKSYFNKEILPFKPPNPPISSKDMLRKVLTYMVFK